MKYGSCTNYTASMNICCCRACKQPFLVEEIGGRGPFQEREDIDCPHCGVDYGSERTAGVFQVRALTDDEEAEWRKGI